MSTPRHFLATCLDKLRTEDQGKKAQSQYCRGEEVDRKEVTESID